MKSFQEREAAGSELRRVVRFIELVVVIGVLIGLCFPAVAAEVDPLGWPEATRETHPWTRWWWMGSAVDTTNLTRLLKEYKAAGIGGVEICPIYGAKGYESRFIDFLSPRWMDMLADTTREAARLDMGVDMTTGTGWPFGGPRVSTEDASSKITLKRYDVAGGGKLNSTLPEGDLRCLMAVSESGEPQDLTGKVVAGKLDWTAPAGKWRLYAVVESGPAQQVKRSAPGGEGNVLDPFSTNALGRYLADFDKAFSNYSGAMPRSQFHDSYEYYGAQWTPEFFDEFAKRRGYDLRTQLPALFGEGTEEREARVQCDYRETISDLHRAYIEYWTDWSHKHGSLSRDQAHGSPANLLDVYAASDIPETEIFGDIKFMGITLNKFSTSAAHVTGRRLASSESFTWLTEHFQASWSNVKQAADYLFLIGVNHIFFHGIPYSPAEAPWPGWQFYAAVNFGPQGGLWHDMPEFAGYVTRCQSVLQSGTPANDVLLYYPVYDVWQTSGRLTIQNPISKSLTNAALALWNRGYGFDYVSDQFLNKAKRANGGVSLGGRSYRTVLVPKCSVMPAATLSNLVGLAKSGTEILFEGGLPSDVPGFGNLEARRAEFQKLIGEIKSGRESNSAAAAQGGPEIYRAGAGRVLVGPDYETLLMLARVEREPCVDTGLRFVRRDFAEGRQYFIANRGDHAVDGWVPFASPAKSAIIMDPRFEDHTGVVAIREGDGVTQVYLQLQPGESCILRTFADKKVSGPAWEYFQSNGAPAAVAGTWKLEFVDGGPEMPKSFETNEPGSWTKNGDAETKRFAGTARYSIEFDRPPGEADDWLLDLGKVCESANIKLNGQAVGAAWCAPFLTRVGPLLRPGKNILEVEVTNLAANRIADMDRRKENWKYFYNVNMNSKLTGRLLDASNWPEFDSGLLGPVTLTPLKRMDLSKL